MLRAAAPTQPTEASWLCLRLQMLWAWPVEPNASSTKLFLVVDTVVLFHVVQVSFRNRVLILFDWLKAQVFGRDLSQF